MFWKLTAFTSDEILRYRRNSDEIQKTNLLLVACYATTPRLVRLVLTRIVLVSLSHGKAFKLLLKSLSVKVTLRYVIPSRVLQKWSKEYQPIAPHLFFWMISCYCLLDGSYKLTGETNSFVEGYSHFVGLFLFPNASLLLGSYPTTWGGSFLSTHMEKNEKVCAASS